jgi:hypothetical protein
LIYLKDAFENAQILAPQAGRKSDPLRPFFAWPRPKPMEGSVSFYRRPLFSSPRRPSCTNLSAFGGRREEAMTAILVDEAGVRAVADPADIRSRVGQGAFFWLDLVGGDRSARTAWLAELGFDVADIAWAMRFGQTGRMLIGRQRLRPSSCSRSTSGTE